MLSIKVLEGLNIQLGHEEKNSRLYLQMAAWCETHNLRGAAKWFYDATDDETKHKMLLAHYIADRNELFKVPKQEAPEVNPGNVLELFNAVLKVEQDTSSNLKKLYELAMREGDFITSEFLAPMLTEQIEEEDKVQTAIDFITISGTTAPGLALIDHFLEEQVK